MIQAQRPEQGLTYTGGRPREEDVLTRRRTSFWDRIKWLALLAIIWLLLVWSLMSNDPLVGFVDACRIQVREAYWVFILAGLELIHQLHYFISEHSAGYNQFWIKQVWGRWDRFSERKISAWTKFRISRVISWIVILVVIAIITGKIIHTSPLLALLRIPQIVWGSMPFVIQMVFTLFFVVAQFGLIFWFLSRGGVDVYYPDDIKTRFSDVWGQDHVLDRVKENIIFLEHPELVEDRGGYVPGGILLWGPPGTGKTLMAEAVAGETGRPYVFVDPGAFINMFMGVGVLKVKGLFRKLRKLSLRYGGVIVFFDEADSLGNRGMSMGGAPGGGNVGAAPFATAGCHGFSYLSEDTRWRLAKDVLHTDLAADPATDPAEPGSRRNKQMVGGMMNGGGGGGGMGTLQALLTELSGLKKPRGFINRVVRRALGMRPKPPPHYRILIMMATNMPSALDEALLRPGRIDRMYRVGYPSKAGRIRTYEGYFAKVAHELTTEQMDKLATITPYATGATIKDLVNEALITAIRDGRDVITWQDVIKAKQLKELGPPEDVEYIERERHAVAIHEACHAVVAYRTRHHMEIDIATIEKGSDYLGMVSSIKPEDQFTRWRSEYEADILVALASLAGERMFFDSDSSSGVSGDLDSATTVASYMEGYWGMGKTVSSAASSRRLEAGTPGGAGRASAVPGGTEGKGPNPFGRLADRIEDNLGLLLLKAEDILRENERHVLALAHALETNKTLSGEDVTAVLEGSQGPLVDGSPYGDDNFINRLRDYHQAAKLAHQEHNAPLLQLPTAEPVFAGYGASPNGAGYLDGSYGANGNGNGTGSGSGSGSDDVIDFGGFGTGAGSNGTSSHGTGTYGAPTYDPPNYGGTESGTDTGTGEQSS
jgi:cell division protease FtsH